MIHGGDGRDILRGETGDDEIEGGPGRDQFYDCDGTNRLSGGEGKDIIFGSIGPDDLRGGPGDDVFLPSEADDVLNGGPGNDAISYKSPIICPGGYLNNVDIHIDLGTGMAIGLGSDQLFSIESARGGGGNDTLLGDKNDNKLTARGGNDILIGMAGDDVLKSEGDLSETDTYDGGEGNDTIKSVSPGSHTVDGGEGFDVLTFDLACRVEANLATDIATFACDDPSFSLPSIEGLVGTPFTANTLIGDGRHNWLIGGIRADKIHGGGGDDSIQGLRGKDRLFGDGGADELDGGPAEDMLNGGVGIDDCVRGETYVDCEGH